MKRILFVDDEPFILNALRRLLRPMRDQWKMAFVNSGTEALSVLERFAFDVIVTDMRMPNMDGAQLLREVSRLYPHMVRIVLSGQSCKEASVRAVGIAHQFLSKPCDPDALKRTIDRAVNLRVVLANDRLKGVLTQTESLPSMPSVFAEINEEIQHPDASSRSIGSIIARDPGMTAKVLQLVNSSFFCLPRQVVNPVDAVALLGIETLRSLVLTAGVFAAFEMAEVKGFDIQRVCVHSMRVGALAKRIAVAHNAPHSVIESSMMAGLLHDVGKMILAQNLPATYAKALNVARESSIPLFKAEQDFFGASHAEAGAYLLALWGLPDAILEAVAMHHDPIRSPGTEFDPLAAVHVANALVNETLRTGGCFGQSCCDDGFVTRLDLTSCVSSWRELARGLLLETATT